MTHPRCALLEVHGLDDLVCLDVINLGHAPELLHDAICEPPGVPVKVPVVDLLDARGLGDQRVSLVGHLQEIKVISHQVSWGIWFEDDDI